LKLHVQCDRCKRYAETVNDGALGVFPQPPKGWHHIRAFCAPYRIDGNYGLPEGVLAALLCGDCMPIVQKAVEAAIARKT
jgi:hypothetical protein